MKTINVLAVDFGASGGKAVLAGFDGKRLDCHEVHRFENAPCHVFSNLYWNIFSLFDNLKTAVGKAVQSGHGITSLGIDSWATDFGVLDVQGNLLGNPHSYMDDRTLSVMDEVESAYSPYELFAKTGIEPHYRFGLFQMLAMKRDETHILDNAKTALFMPNLLGYFCTGNFSCEATQASTTLLYDPFSRSWNDEIFERFDLPNLFPKLNDTASVLGVLNDSVKEDTRAGNVKVINVPQHDSATAMLSASASNRDTLFICCGSWSIIGTYIDEPIVTREAFDKKFNNQAAYNGRIMFVKNVLGHWILHQCMKEWGREGDTISFDELENGVRDGGFESFIDLNENWLNIDGSITAHITENCAKRGMTPPVSRSDIYASVLNALVKEYKATLYDLSQITNRAFKRVHVVGGGAKSKYLCELIARETGLAVMAGPYEATAIGSIVAQLIALGEIEDEAEADLVIQNSFSIKCY